MVGFLGVIIVLLAIAGGLLMAVKINSKKSRGDGEETSISVRPVGIVLAGLLIIAGFIIAGSIGQVSAGYRAVVLEFGAVTNKTLNEGLYMVTPLVNTVELMDVQTHAYEAEASAASKDIQDVHTKVTLNYALDPTKVNTIYQTLRLDYLDRIVKPAVQESVKATTARFTAEELITKRPVVKTEIEGALKDRLAIHGVIAETISITDFTFSPNFTQSIEAKMVAAQDALKAENKLRQIEVEARQAKQVAEGQKEADIARAQGQKQSAILRAEGEAQATVTVADAQSKANKVLADSLRNQPELLKYVLYQKLGGDIKVMILPSSQEFILGSDVLAGK